MGKCKKVTESYRPPEGYEVRVISPDELYSYITQGWTKVDNSELKDSGSARLGLCLVKKKDELYKMRGRIGTNNNDVNRLPIYPGDNLLDRK